MNNAWLLWIFLAYLILLTGFGWAVSRRQRSGDDFLLAGRGLPVFLTAGTTIATMVGTGSSMGAVGFSYANGWAGALYGLGGGIGIILLGIFFAPVRSLRFSTMSEELAHYVGNNSLLRGLLSVLIFAACIGWLGAHILGGGLYLAWIAGIDMWLARLIIALGFAVFVIVGGYRAVVWTDSLQALVLFAGFIVLAVLSVREIGGLQPLMSMREFGGGQPLAPLHAVSLVVVIAVGMMAAPSFRQRIYSARSEAAARSAFLISGGLYLLFCIVPTVVGICAYALEPGLENRNFAFPYLAVEVLPLAAGAVVLIAGLSATLSSASSDAMAGVSVLTRDFGFEWKSDKSEMRFSRFGLALVIGIAFAMASLSDDLIGYITAMISTVMSGLFVCGLLGRFWSGFTWQGAVAALLGGSLVSLLVLWRESGFWSEAFWGNPVLPALAAALLAGVAASLVIPQGGRLENKPGLAEL